MKSFVAAFGLLSLFAPQIASARQPAPTGSAAGDKSPVTVSATLTPDEVAAVAKQIHEGAAADAVRALEKHPAVTTKNREAEILYGLALYFTGRLREANNIALKYQGAASSTNPYQLKLVGYTMLGQDNPTGAITFFKLAASRLQKDAECAFNIARCTALIQADLPSLAKAREFEARKAELPKGQFESAIGEISLRIADKMVADNAVNADTFKLLTEACEIAPDDVELPTLLASLYVESKDFDKANEILARMEKRFDNKLEIPQFLRGRIAEKKGDFKQALSLAEVSVQLSNRKYLPALLLQARMAIQLGQLDDARRALDSAINSAPSNYDARTMMGHYMIERSKEAKETQTRHEYLRQAEENLLNAKKVMNFGVVVNEELVTLYTLMGESKKTELAAVKLDLERAKKLHP